MQTFARAFLVLAITLLAALAARAEEGRRVALVIGNADYDHARPLANPRNDANEVADALVRLGFDVTLGIDLDSDAMARSIQRFDRELKGADTAVVYYAGHGWQVGGRNYLTSVDADPSQAGNLTRTSIRADLIMSRMQAAGVNAIMILDACRDDPTGTGVAAAGGRSLSIAGGQTIQTGLADMSGAGGGVLLAYATDPGNVACDGDGRHSPFTDALLRHIETPGLEINLVLARVRLDVHTATGGRQSPWTNSSLLGEVYLNGSEPEVSGPGISIGPGVTFSGNVTLNGKPWQEVLGVDPSTESVTIGTTEDPTLRPAAPRDQVEERGMDDSARLDDADENFWSPEQQATFDHMEAWREASEKDTVRAYRAYLKAYPDGAFNTIARMRIDRLER